MTLQNFKVLIICSLAVGFYGSLAPFVPIQYGLPQGSLLRFLLVEVPIDDISTLGTDLLSWTIAPSLLVIGGLSLQSPTLAPKPRSKT